jgi:solute carrier family 45 protein 1/2/4
MSYVNVYLMSLGMTKSVLSIVWIAGPISGLVMQPIVGVLSDNSTSRFGRRRPYMVVGSLFVGCGLMVMAWAKEIVNMFPLPYHVGSVLTLCLATWAIFVTDFSINAVQASCRALIVDTLAQDQQELGNGWAGRMIAIGHLTGYFFGYVDLVKVTGGLLGDTQLKALCAIASMVLLSTVAITCVSVAERVLVSNNSSNGNLSLHLVITTVVDIFRTIISIVSDLPPRISLIFKIQLCAWYGWFGFLFYSSTWVGEVYIKYNAKDFGADKNADLVGEIARRGALSLMVFSFVSLASSLIFPELVGRKHNFSVTTPPPYRPTHGVSRTLNVIYRGIQGLLRALMRPFNYLLLRLRLLNIQLIDLWLASHLIYAFSSSLTAYVHDVSQATFLVALCGYSWAMTIWAPFALLAEEILKLNSGTEMVPLGAKDDDDMDEDFQEDLEQDREQSGSTEKSGVYLGIHNVAITVPQLVATFVSFVVFSSLQVDADSSTDGNLPQTSGGGDGGLGIARTLQIGSVPALAAAYLTWKLKKLR